MRSAQTRPLTGVVLRSRDRGLYSTALHTVRHRGTLRKDNSVFDSVYQGGFLDLDSAPGSYLGFAVFECLEHSALYHMNSHPF